MNFNRRTAIILTFLFVIAFVVRLPSLKKPFLTYGEANRVIWGKKRLGNLNPSSKAWGTQPSFLVVHAPIPFYYYGGWAKLGEALGATGYLGNIYWARIGGVLLGALSIPLIFLLGERLFNEKEGIIAALILAFLPLTVGWSRVGFAISPSLFSYLLAFYLFFKTKEWKKWKRVSILGLASGIAFSIKYTNILLPLILGFLWLLYSKKSLIRDEILKKKYRINKKTAQFFDFLIISSTFLIISFLFLTLIFPYLWKGPISQFLWLKDFLGKGSGSFSLFTFIQHFIDKLPKFIVYWLVKIPALILGLGIFGIYIGLKKKEKKHLFLLTWLILPFSLAAIPIHSSVKYKFPAIGSLILFSALAFYNILETEKIKNMFNSKLTPISLLSVYLIGSLVLCYPYPVGGYFNEVVGFGKGAYELKKSGSELMPSPGRGYGAGEAYRYVTKNAPINSTVQFYVSPNVFYLGVDKSLRYINPTKPPKAQYVLLNSHYALKSNKPKWWYRVSNQEEPNKKFSLNYEEMKENPEYQKVWSTGTLIGTPISAVYKHK